MPSPPQPTESVIHQINLICASTGTAGLPRISAHSGGYLRPALTSLGDCCSLTAHTISSMEMPRAHPRWGIEFDWLGVDQCGHVAVFATVGYGPVPKNVNPHLDKVDRVIEHLCSLPVTGKADR